MLKIFKDKANDFILVATNKMRGTNWWFIGKDLMGSIAFEKRRGESIGSLIRKACAKKNWKVAKDSSLQLEIAHGINTYGHRTARWGQGCIVAHERGVKQILHFCKNPFNSYADPKRVEKFKTFFAEVMTHLKTGYKTEHLVFEFERKKGENIVLFPEEFVQKGEDPITPDHARKEAPLDTDIEIDTDFDLRSTAPDSVPHDEPEDEPCAKIQKYRKFERDIRDFGELIGLKGVRLEKFIQDELKKEFDLQI